MTGPANLGFFESSIDRHLVTRRAENVWVLVVHYDYKGKDVVRKGDDVDVKNLRSTFEEQRNCNFRDLLSVEKEHLLLLLSDHTKLFTLFDCNDIPDVFVLFFLSHGAEDGVIYTDHCDQDDLIIYFTTDEIFQSLKRLTGFDKCLKLVNFGPCRGELEDGKMRCPRPDRGDYDNRNSCRITFDPEMHNLVIFYSTVEKTQSNRDANCGSWFVEEFCRVLNSMEEDQLLLSALSSVQRRIHVKSRGYNLGAQKHDGQTPEAKLFSQDALFYFSKHPKPTKITNFTDGIGNTKNIIFASDFYSWRADSGKNLRGRRAFILHDISNDDSVSAMYKALSQNLHFETSERKLSGRAIELLFKDVKNSDEDVGCVLTCIFGQVSEKIIKEKQADPEFMRNPKKEICVLVDGEEKPITDILHRFCGPHNEAWIGKPKIFFILDQTKMESDYLNLRQNNYEILATNHSGWLVLVLKEKRQIAKLIEILNGDDLKKGKCLQRLLYPLLVGETKGNVLLNSTLQHLLDFPEWPRSFVKPDFKLKRGKNSAEQVLTFDDLLQEAKETLKENRVWLLSSVAGSGKTTVLREIAFQLGKADCDVKILRIVLPKFRIYFLKKHQVNEVEFLAMASNYSSKEIADWIASNKIVVFLDGFDEICPEYREKVVGLVRVLKERGLPLWIGTRPHEADEIRDKVAQNVVSISIRSFDETKQNELLNLVAKRNEEENKLFLKSFVANTFLGNPLHLSMLAECGFEDNLYNMYNRVVKQKVKFCLERENGNYMVSVEKVELALIPLRLIASRFISERCLVGQGVSMEQVERMNNFGIATFLDGEVTFLHQTFAEFLAAQQFLIDFQVSGTSGLRMFDRCQWWDYAECRKFVDAYFYNNEDKFEKHSEIVLKMAIDTSPYNFLDIVCCEDLKNIFNLLKPNVSFCLEKERPIRIRNGPRLLLRAIQNEEIAIGLVELGAIDNRKLKKIQRQLLDAIFENNAAKLYKRINDQFSGAFSLLMQETHFETRKKEQLFDAARKGNAEVLTLLIENGGDPNATHDHRNAIYASCEAGHIRCVEILFANNAKVANYFGKTHDPLIVASANGHLDIVKYLLVADQFVRDTETLEIEELKENWNAFHYAIARNQMETAAHLLSISSNLKRIKTEGGMSPLQLAALKNNLKMCRWLVKEGADLKSLLVPGDSMLVCKDHFLMLQGDVNFKDESGKTALHCATQYCYEELVLQLIDAGADVKATDQNGWNALHFACVCNASKRIIKILHKKSNALASQRTNNGETALHIFFQTFRKDKTFVVDFVHFLVEEVGVDCEAVDNQGRPALSMVPEQFCWYKAPNYAAIVVKNGKSGINSAAKRGDLNELLKCINMGTDINL
ncbi:Hypothetical predicted protein [Cloeon dipterum]|uniref:NACHT domain-containing protein n=1 Tax=Cloeon dipterum TaxID=197152 RepID=A0A8S1DGP0_9INSE|nr:Hypothetical predicted protein [Cloeon dipterum]